MGIVGKEKWTFWWRQEVQEQNQGNRATTAQRRFLALHKEELSNNESVESGVTVPGGLSGPRRWLGVRGIPEPQEACA